MRLWLAAQPQVDLGASEERLWDCLLKRPAQLGGCLTAWVHVWLHCAIESPAGAFQTHFPCLQVTTYPNGSILVAANRSAVLTSSNATSNTSSAYDVYGSQPLERYIGEAAVQHAWPCSQHTDGTQTDRRLFTIPAGSTHAFRVPHLHADLWGRTVRQPSTQDSSPHLVGVCTVQHF